ncbi:GNAT family N-acetyltransferase [Parasphingorhabdus halotolerans]|uniref:GNAT family N-acetyltransferase n=1 Tax=Parasphingorhabdus halotolerans TaxID=2725558 RepID=A0A6H2DQQ1_9SPHN|nr:GNAT family N-acetyltransferase [Parasphingorhabdus halotolerans]QJB70091.1 GNAT family N-acetyltransferase [Parasphingorhabdus halotolerans]
MQISSITTDRLVLRKPQLSDSEQLILLANDWEVAKYLARLPHPYGLEDADFFFTEVVEKEMTWALILDDKFIGTIGLVRHHDSSLELGYWIGRPYWGKGYVTEAARAVLQWAQTVLPDSRIVSGCFIGNDASYKILEKLGFVETGRSSRFALAQVKDLEHRDMMLRSEE